MSSSPTLLKALTDTAIAPLTEAEQQGIHAYWRACNYLCVGMLYLLDNPLLREPLKPEHIKHRLLGHWGSDPGQTFIWVHLNRLIKKYDLDLIYIAGPHARRLVSGTLPKGRPKRVRRNAARKSAG